MADSRTELQKMANRFDSDLFRLMMEAHALRKENNEQSKDDPWTFVKWRLVEARGRIAKLMHPDDLMRRR